MVHAIFFKTRYAGVGASRSPSSTRHGYAAGRGGCGPGQNGGALGRQGMGGILRETYGQPGSLQKSSHHLFVPLPQVWMRLRPPLLLPALGGEV